MDERGVLSDTGEKSRGLRLLRRWFGDEDSTDDCPSSEILGQEAA